MPPDPTYHPRPFPPQKSAAEISPIGGRKGGRVGGSPSAGWEVGRFGLVLRRGGWQGLGVGEIREGTTGRGGEGSTGNGRPSTIM